jgi:uncharacterized protein YndB with AHSA1/START domain
MPDHAESIRIAAPAGAVYALVSDLPKMPSWSPECSRVTWSGSVDQPAVGTRFIGHNRVGAFRWFTQGEVTEATPGERFTFKIHFGPVPVALWSYTFSEVESGCEVTESWTDRRPAALRRTFGLLFGDRDQRNRRGIHITLTKLKSTAELPVG